MMTTATKKPAPESAANTGLTWALVPLVVSGTVDGAGDRRPPIPTMVAEVGAVSSGVDGG
jgi:hypothetical protein